MSEDTPPPERYLEVSIDGQPRRFPVTDGQVCRIGRAERNTIVLASSQVSRDHALVDCPNGKSFVLTDLGSANGTLVNGVRVASPAILKDGDFISIGEFSMIFREPPRDDSGGQNSLAGTTFRVVNEEITVMVVDIRGYTPLSLKVGADRLGEMMGYFIRESGSLLRAQGAWGQKYIGDAVMAIWMHDSEQPGSHFARKALLSVRGINEIAKTLQALFVLDDPVRIGAGINTGFASIGNLGSSAAADYTALGDTVNKAFRLESATKDAGCDVLVGHSTLSLWGKKMPTSLFETRQVELKGYSSPETCYGLSFETLADFLRTGESTEL